jgi:titin
MFSWFRKQGRRPSRHVRPAVHPAIEVLENRLAPAVLTVNTLQDDNPSDFLSLREAVSVVNSGSMTGLSPAQQNQISDTLGTNDTIVFAPGLSGTITLTGGAIGITQDVTIDGPGAGVLSVSGNAAGPIFGTTAAVGINGLTLTDGQSAGVSGGAINQTGGSLWLADCVLSNNHVIGSNGGAIESVSGGSLSLTITNCTFTGNSADGNGGAIDSPGVILTISGSTFDHNTTNADGGAVSIGTGTVNLTNCTFTANAASGRGGAINSNFAADFALLNCTIAGNSAFIGGGVVNTGSGTFTLTNSIVANDTASAGGNDVAGVTASGGNCLVKDTNPGSGSFTPGPGDLAAGTDPMLGPLADNGGPTQTMALLPGSPAINAGNAANAPLTDQRSLTRFGNTDIGALEYQFKVTNTNDSGAGSLRQAILNSNATPLNASGNPNVIQFDIPGSGVHVIQPLTTLPTVTQTTDIDGYSQPGAAPNTLAVGDNAVLVIRLDGGQAGPGVNGLVLAAADSTVEGLDITGFSGNGVVAQSAGDLIAGNFIGIGPDGNTSAGNGGDGVLLSSVSDTIVGGTTAATRNLISSNAGSGVEVQAGGTGNVIEGNYIGTSANGTAALGNNTASAPFGGGVSIMDGQSVLVGGGTAGAGNLISGNGGVGVYIYGSAANGNKVQGNKIGTDISGTATVGNNQSGVSIDNGASANFIGTDGDGVNDATEGNLISGNGGSGILLGASGIATNNNVVAGNFIGTNAAGTAALGNTIDGITIDVAAGNRIGTNADGVSDTLERNLISGNDQFGISITGAGVSGNVVAGNFIGTDGSGSSAVGNALAGVFVGSGASGNTVGGTTAADRNVISGNFGDGLEISGSGADGNVVEGNYLGTSAAGAAALANGGNGVFIDSGASNNTVGGSTAGAGNVISGNGANGVQISGGSGDLVQGNFIGTSAAGTAAVGNGQDGILLDSGTQSVTVGGTASAAANVISGNFNHGVEINGSSANQVQGNFIGTDVNGAPVLGNADDGVLLWQGASGNTVGGSGAAANLIAGNGASAVEINQTQGLATGNQVQGLSRSTDTLTYVAQPGVTASIDFSAGAISEPPGVSNTFVGLSALTLDADGGAADLRGGAFANEVETPSAADAGSATFDGSFTVNYENATQLQDTAPLTGTVSYNGTAAGETIDIVDGGTVDGLQATRLDIGDSGALALGPVLFANKPAVLVNGVGGADTFTVNNPHPGAGLSHLTVQAGPGGSTFNILTAAAGVSTAAVGGAGNDSFNVTASLAAGVVLTIDGGGGNNALAFDAQQQQHAVGTIPGALTVDASGQRVNYTNITGLNLQSALAVDALYGPDTADRGTALAPSLTPEERFVELLYLDALGRVGNLAEIDGWAAQFGQAGLSHAQAQNAIAAGIEQSPEARDHLVKCWYMTYLGRQAQGGEEQVWVNRLLAGQTEEQVLSQILASSEFFSRAQTLGFGDTPDGNYMHALYQLLLHRSAGSAEVAGWEGSGLDRQGVALGFLQSTEYRTYLFEGYYNALLHRPDDLAGLDNWVGSGLDAHTARVDFESGGEFYGNG